MKIFIVALFIAAGYYFILSATSDMALSQVENFSQQYNRAVQYADAAANTDIAQR